MGRQEVLMAKATSDYESFYNEKRAASDLRKYRQKGAIPSTRALIEALKAEGVEGATLLDIGGGIGAIQHELIDAGVAHATSVEASRPYIDAAREESQRRGHDGRVTYLCGDFIELADSVTPAEIVTLDRVINVYPDWERLAELAAARASRVFGLVYPRDTRIVRLVTFGMNLVLRVLRKPVRASVRPHNEIERIAREGGLSSGFSRDVGQVWQIAVFRRM
jgi:2-polyprenyl-3-methyl-5-hydroxy-6-metoxy-1,4-benzoquinol methylase